ncbi:L,D-transpeptidase [Corynebacterium durum]|uniref:L,D-transpeptidase n=1 Tax=Corynebacterium durum TaxID=61592 RepID=UPI00288094B5|nr:Ig-like domain-containing protein [Corynebacterium durum]
MPGLRPLTALGAVGLLAGALILGGCAAGQNSGDKAVDAAAEASKSAENKKPEASVKDGQKDVNPAKPITVKIGDGELSTVTMTNEDGKVVEASLDKDKKKWETTEPLGYSRTYTLTIEAKGEKKQEMSFSTIDATNTTAAALSPLPESTVGVGQTIGIKFDTNIENRQAAQDAITVKTEPKVEGQFFWLNNSEVRWRPKDFWEPGTKVDVKVDIYGVDLGGGVYGEENNNTNFTIGDKVVAVADDNTKTMTIKRGEEVLKTMPISMGSGKYPTPHGTYIIGDKHPTIVMDSSSYGLAIDAPDGYRTNVQFATQMSYSGIFVHAAPWSVGSQGVENVSHGCINVSTDNAQWFQDNLKRGDIVQVRNTIGEELSGYDGLGDWNIPWETWGKGNVNETSAW